MYTEKTLTCQDCGQGFTFTAEEQEFFSSKGYSEPKRCPTCRQARKAERGGGGGGGYRGGGGGGGGGGYREMFPATCAECGRQTEVPFEPRNDRPVYCRDCFSRRQPMRSGR